MKNSKQKHITAALFCDILNGKSPLPKGRILVIGDVELPRHVETLPPDVIFDDSLYLERTQLREFNHVVKGLGFFRSNRQLRQLGPNTSFGALDMEGCPIEEFNIRVEGNVSFSNFMRKLKIFGPNAYFGGDLDARGTSLRSFNHVVCGTVTLIGLKSLKTIGPDAQFGGNVYLGDTSIQEFDNPVKGNLILICGNGWHISDERKCFFRRCGTKTLGKIGPKAVIAGHLDARCSPIKEFCGHVNGDANFAHTHITKLPATARIKGKVTLSDGVYSEEFLVPQP